MAKIKTANAEIMSHPIQLKFIGVRELHIETFEPPTPNTEMPNIESCIKMTLGYDGYNDGAESFQVQVNLEIGESIEEKKKTGDRLPFYLKILLKGIFHIDEKFRSKERIDYFIEKNALYILHPFLREHVFALSSRGGIKPIVLPLLTIPIPEIAPKAKKNIKKKT